ncbi:MAG: hypothetical protein Q9214_004433, partial [Letrouitia sp. 1 TL-2023]
WVPYEQTPTNRPNQNNYGLLGAWPYGNTIPTQPRSSARVKIESPSVTASKKDSSGDATTMVNSSTESDEDEQHTVSKVDFATSGQVETPKSPSRPKL